jgi:hypothetical protein
MASHTTTAVFQRGGAADRPAASAFGGLAELVVATTDPSFHPRPSACKRVRAAPCAALQGCDRRSRGREGPARGGRPRRHHASPPGGCPARSGQGVSGWPFAFRITASSCRAHWTFPSASKPAVAGHLLLTMEVWERHARTRAITRDTVFHANHDVLAPGRGVSGRRACRF